MLIMDYLVNNAKQYADKIAVSEVAYDENKKVLKREMTWKEFNEKANKIANSLITMGVKKNDKVVILLSNCLEWLPIYFGILKSGAIAVPVNYRNDASEINYCLSKVQGKVVFMSLECENKVSSIIDEFKETVSFVFLEASDKIPNYGRSIVDLIECSSTEESSVDSNITDLATIYFSSGTTGVPKAIMLSHKALVSACQTEKAHHYQTSEDVFICIPPLYHTGAKMHWFGSLVTGSSVVLLLNVSPRCILDTISNEKVTIAFLLVPWVQDILASIECGDIDCDMYNFEQWRLTHMGAQPISSSLIQKWLKIFPKQSYDTNYGLSEATGPGCTHLGLDNIHKAGSIGKAGYGWQIKIVDNQGKLLSKGETGELAVKGDAVMMGYYDDPESTEAVLKDGWLLTGDMAYEDNDGFIYIVGRKKDIIISGGENVSAVQIEEFIQHHEAVKDVAVIGINNDRDGEIIAAIIELKQNVKCKKIDMIRFCKGIPAYKRPRVIIFDSIPRNSTGKIEKEKLRSNIVKNRT